MVPGHCSWRRSVWQRGELACSEIAVDTPMTPGLECGSRMTSWSCPNTGGGSWNLHVSHWLWAPLEGAVTLAEAGPRSGGWEVESAGWGGVQGGVGGLCPEKDAGVGPLFPAHGDWGP